MPKSCFTPPQGGTNKFSRRWGATTGTIPPDPYITGYHFVHFVSIPKTLETTLQHTLSPSLLNTVGDVGNFLDSACIAVTLPGATVNKAEFNGLGNVRWAVPSNVDWDNTCTLRFIEFSGLPVHQTMHAWVRMIRDYRYGASWLGAKNDVATGGTNGTYTKSDYACSLYYWTTEPNGVQVEYHCAITGMFPMKDPTDQFGHDLTAYDKLEIDIDWNVDYLWHEDWTLTNCQTFSNSWESNKATINAYGQTDSPTG